MFAEVRVALGFLTTLPIPQPPFDPARFGRAGRWYPLCGLVIGALLAVVYLLAGTLFAPVVTATLVVAAWAGLTGGLHLDGLADCADGLLPPVEQERRLEIMRDPRVGAFGVIALVLALGLKSGAIATSLDGVTALILAPVWARWTLLLAASQPPARPDGLGAGFAAGLTGGALLPALATAAIATIAVLIWRGPLVPALLLTTVGAILAVHGAAAAVILLARRRLGGVTGDVFGLVVECGELAILLVLARGG